MFKENESVYLYGIKLDYKQFEYLLNRFKEAFSHASLSIEQAFKELSDIDFEISSKNDNDSLEKFKKLSLSDKNYVMNIVRQIIVFYQFNLGAIDEKLDGSQKQINRIYNDKFRYFDNYVLYFLKFDENDCFDKVATLRNMEFLAIKLPVRKLTYESAYNMQKDNLDAFDYAMKLDTLSIDSIIKINALVNKSDDNIVEGFKKTNNSIINAPFIPTDKKNVAREMQQLLYDYENNGLGIEILNPFEVGISYDERNRRLNNIFRREALFHIKFERIHPFNDGNGRTGRIILNHHLLTLGIPPVLITDVMSAEYKKLINNYDVDSLCNMFFASASQLMTNWISLIKGGISINRSNIKIDNKRAAKIVEFIDIDAKTKKRF